jgi:hypothetical protein
MSNREAAAASERPLAVFGPDRATPFAGWEITARYATPEEAARAKDLLTAASAPQAVRITQQAVLVVACYDDLPVAAFAQEDATPEDPRITAFVSAIAALRAALIVPLAPQDTPTLDHLRRLRKSGQGPAA